MKRMIAALAVVLGVYSVSFAGWKEFNKSVDKIGSAVEVGVTRPHFLELLADANSNARGICETMEQGKQSGSWYCLAFWQFRAMELSWKGNGKPKQEVVDAALSSVANARKSKNGMMKP